MCRVLYIAYNVQPDQDPPIMEEAVDETSEDWAHVRIYGFNEKADFKTAPHVFSHISDKLEPISTCHCCKAVVGTLPSCVGLRTFAGLRGLV